LDEPPSTVATAGNHDEDEEVLEATDRAEVEGECGLVDDTRRADDGGANAEVDDAAAKAANTAAAKENKCMLVIYFFAVSILNTRTITLSL